MPKIRGTNGNNLLDGTPWDDIIEGLAGDDTINGLGDSDFLDGGDGDDVLDGGGGNSGFYNGDTLHGGNGDDSLDGGDGADRLTGGAGNDTLDGGDGNDTLFVTTVWDVKITDTAIVTDNLLLGQGTDSFFNIEDFHFIGGVTNQVFDARGFSQRVLFECRGGSDTLYGGAGRDTLFDSESYRDSHPADGRDYLYGYGGNDFLFSGGDGNYLNGGAGNDTLELYGRNVGDNTFIGGDGFDTLLIDVSIFHYPPVFEHVTLTDTKLVRQGHGTDTLSGIEKIEFDSGTYATQWFDGRGFSGQIELFSAMENDTLFGGTGDDILASSWGNDLLFGGAGDDTILGGHDFDTATFVAQGAFTLTDTSAEGQGLDKLGSIEMAQVQGRARGQKL